MSTSNTTSAPSLSTTLHTDRLRIYLVDPANDTQCEAFCRFSSTNQRKRGKTGPSTTVDDVKRKTKSMGPRAELCTLAPPPVGMIHLFELLDPDQPSDSGSAIIGSISLGTRSDMPCPDLGYAVMLEHEGKGYAFEAASAVLNFWRETVGIKEIFAATRAANVRSQRLAERLGFVRGGELGFASGPEPDAEIGTGVAFVLPGMEWREGQVMIPDPSTGPPIQSMVVTTDDT